MNRSATARTVDETSTQTSATTAGSTTEFWKRYGYEKVRMDDGLGGHRGRREVYVLRRRRRRQRR